MRNFNGLEQKEREAALALACAEIIADTASEEPKRWRKLLDENIASYWYMLTHSAEYGRNISESERADLVGRLVSAVKREAWYKVRGKDYPQDLNLKHVFAVQFRKPKQLTLVAKT